MKQCPNCGNQNADDARFCNGCGTPLDNTIDTQQPMASVPPTMPTPPTPPAPAAPVPPTPPSPPAGQPMHPAMPPLPESQPQQPQMPPQPMRKKNNTGRVIAIAAGVIIFLAAAASLFYWWVMKSDTPTYEDPVTVCDSAVADSTAAVEVADSMAASAAIEVEALADEEAAAAGDELATSSFPNIKHGSDQAFENYVSSLGRKGIAYDYKSGSGILGGGSYSVEFVVMSGGRLTGRYHNEYNGLNLDLNGYFADDGTLHLMLGHKNETSYMVLRPARSYNTYSGYWGKSKKPSTLTLD